MRMNHNLIAVEDPGFPRRGWGRGVAYPKSGSDNILFWSMFPENVYENSKLGRKEGVAFLVPPYIRP